MLSNGRAKGKAHQLPLFISTTQTDLAINNFSVMFDIPTVRFIYFFCDHPQGNIRQAVWSPQDASPVTCIGTLLNIIGIDVSSRPSVGIYCSS